MRWPIAVLYSGICKEFRVRVLRVCVFERLVNLLEAQDRSDILRSERSFYRIIVVNCGAASVGKFSR